MTILFLYYFHFSYHRKLSDDVTELPYNADQITGELNAAKNALLQVMQRLRANIFETDGSSSAFPIPPPVPVPSLATQTEAFEGQSYVNRDNRTRNQGYSTYSGGYSTETLPPTDSYGSFDDPQVAFTLTPLD